MEWVLVQEAGSALKGYVQGYDSDVGTLTCSQQHSKEDWACTRAVAPEGEEGCETSQSVNT